MNIWRARAHTVLGRGVCLSVTRKWEWANGRWDDWDPRGAHESSPRPPLGDGSRRDNIPYYNGIRELPYGTHIHSNVYTV